MTTDLTKPEIARLRLQHDSVEFQILCDMALKFLDSREELEASRDNHRNDVKELQAEIASQQPKVAAPVDARPYQHRVQNWMMECFSMEICRDSIERNHRFLEESLELVQSLGCTASEAHQLVDYVFNRPVGDPPQEVGGVMVTLAALCSAADIDMAEAGEIELKRIWTCVEKIRAKQAAKPKHSPLPEHTRSDSREPKAMRKGDWKTVTDFLTIHGAWSIREVTDAAERIKDALQSKGCALPDGWQVPPHFVEDEKSSRHPQFNKDWNWHDDARSEFENGMTVKRLNFAADLSDPRAPDQMCLVYRIDVMRLLVDWTHKNAAFKFWIASRAAAPQPPKD